MLESLPRETSNRKLQLFACACTRRIIGLFPFAIIRQAVEFAELDADHGADPEDLTRVQQAFDSASCDTAEMSPHISSHASNSAIRTAHLLVSRRPMFRRAFAIHAASEAANAVRTAIHDPHALQRAPAGHESEVAQVMWQAEKKAHAEELAAQADLLRDIFGNPFRPVNSGPQEGFSEVRAIVQTIYESGDMEKLPRLAKKLEEAGCTDREILGHLRSKGPHVRGCWVVDLLLGKE
jgi:hypothetical protein